MLKKICDKSANAGFKVYIVTSLRNLPKEDYPNGWLVETQVKGHMEDGHFKIGSARPR